MDIVLYSDDISLLVHWEKSLKDKCTSVDNIEDLYSLQDCLIILNYSACTPDCKSVLGELSKNNKVLLLDRTPNMQTARQVLSAGAKGYGNALMRSHFIVSAVETIKENMIWLYPEFTTMLIEEIPTKEQNLNIEKLEMLSEREKEVALLLKDAKTYNEISELLSITPRTVKAHASHIYRKLAVKDRLALALLLK